MNSMTPGELKNRLDTGNPLCLLDVREQWEREAFNIGGLHIPLGEIMSRRNEIPADKEVVVYCEKGIRSGIIIQRLEPLGFTNLYNLEGGMSAWKRMVGW